MSRPRVRAHDHSAHPRCGAVRRRSTGPLGAPRRFRRVRRHRTRPPSEWPPADRVELVVAAGQVRLASVLLPPLPPDRVAAAATFARRGSAGRAHRRAVARGGAATARWPRRDRRSSRARFSRASVRAPSPVRCPASCGWSPSPSSPTRNGRLLVRSGRPRHGRRLRAARRRQRVPGRRAAGRRRAAAGARARAGARAARRRRREQVRVDATVTDEQLARWTRETGIAFVRGKPWSWHAAPHPIRSAVNLLPREFALTAPPPPAAVREGSSPRSGSRRGARAARRGDARRVGVVARRRMAHGAGLARGCRGLRRAGGRGADPAAARAALARRYAQQRHAQGLPAPDDALPLLARAAPALAGLPPGALKSAVYADGHWTLDLRPRRPGGDRRSRRAPETSRHARHRRDRRHRHAVAASEPSDAPPQLASLRAPPWLDRWRRARTPRERG